MHLVFATSIVPDGSPATGYEIANDAIIGALRRAGARVTVLGFIWPGSRPSDPANTIVLGEVDVRTDNASSAQKAKWLARAVAANLTFSSVKLAGIPAETVRQALQRAGHVNGPIDAYVINGVQLAGAFPDVFSDRPSIYVAHNVEFRSAEENAAAATSLAQRLLFRREARLLRTIESRLCDQASFVLTLAEEDREALGVNDGQRSAATPLVTRAVASPPASRRIECDAALIGTWTWQPNRIGLDWFVGEVVPRLRGDFRIRIAGHIPSGFSTGCRNVELVGRVTDAREFVRTGAVVPLVSRAGTGVQLKTIEAFELGLPSVATAHSLRGVGHVPSNCVVTDDPAAFAAALERQCAAPRDADGRKFHRDQQAALDISVRAALQALGPRLEVAA